MKHPLTDEMCMSLFSFERLIDESRPITVEDSMRSAADWQLDQVKEEAKRQIIFLRELGHDVAADTCEDFFEEIMQAMRPQPQEDNNA